MKQILMALLITVMAYSSAEAQVNCKPRHAVKHKSTVTQNTPSPLPVQKTIYSYEACRTVPFDACAITADRMHVSCYKTMDPETFEPLGNYETTYYGPTGETPGEPAKFDIETTVISAATKGDYCKRDVANDQTVCYTDQVRLVRDENGYYSYR